MAPLLALNHGDRVIDSGCGYAWTTEWLLRAGFDPIGVDICRTYLEVGLTRMERLAPTSSSRTSRTCPSRQGSPGQCSCTRASITSRIGHERCARYERVLQDGGVAILAEPGAAHEQAQVAIDAMQRYGILEKGMELVDVQSYAHGTTLAVEQLYLMRMTHGEVGANANETFVKTHAVLEGNLFRLTKRAKPEPPVELAVPGPRPPDASILRRVWQRLRG